MAEDGEEIKIFRVRTEDESDAPSLADDKKDVALEEEMGVDGRSAFHPPSTLSSMPSPLPLFSSAGFNPFQQLAIQQWQMNQAMIANAAANAFAAALSPTFTAHPMPASPLDLFSRTMSALSPLTGPRVGMMGRGLGGMGSALPLASPFPNLLNPMQLMGYGAGMAPSTSTAATGRKRANETSNENQSKKTKKAHNEEDKKEHIKKPKNAFFFFMKENRGVLKSEEEWKDRHSANLNAEFGKRWRELTDEEKQPYYDMAAKDKEDHAKKYPNWNASENYAIRAKNKTKRDRTSKPVEGKKCRARFGLDNQQKWCKNCGIKKKCIFAGKGEEDEKEEREINQTASDSESDLDDEPTTDLTDEELKLKMELALPYFK